MADTIWTSSLVHCQSDKLLVYCIDINYNFIHLSIQNQFIIGSGWCCIGEDRYKLLVEDVSSLHYALFKRRH